MRREFRSLSPPEEVHEALASLDVGGETAEVPLSAAHDRVLAERIDAPIDVPGFARAAMDGYAVRARETFGAGEATPITFAVRGSVHAGEEPSVSVEAGAAAEVATGAVMPAGADAVVPVERVREGDGEVAVESAVTPGENVMQRGADIASGSRALGPGTRLGPRHVGLLAALGRETVPVLARPAVGVVSTGEELVQPGGQCRAEAGQIYDVNSHSIASAVRAAGGKPAVYEAASDDYDDLRETLSRAAGESALLLTSGSTSAGSADLLYDLLADHGETLVHGVAIKPGRPTLVGRIFETPYVGLPGYPVSALTVFQVFVVPRLRSAAGRPEPAGTSVDATLRTRVRYDGGRLRLLPVGLVEDGDGSLVAYAPAKGSGATTTLAETDGVVRLPPEESLLSAGSDVEVTPFDAADPVPSLLGVGDPDPLVAALLDSVSAPRYLTLGPADARRWFANGIPDVLVTAAGESGDGPSLPRGAPDAEVLTGWRREWGLVVPEGNPAGVDGLDALADGDLALSTLDADLTLREAFDDALDAAGIDVNGDGEGLPGIESAARSVAAGRADVGLGLRETAETLGLDFIGVGSQPIRLVAAGDRQGKPAVAALAAAAERTDRLDGLAGYERAGEDG